MISKQLVSHIYTLLQGKATISICLESKTELSNTVLDEGTLITVTESTAEGVSPTKSISEHPSQNVELTSTKIVANRISNRQRRVPVTRNDDFYGETD
jgi:hypothetical protein